MNAQAPQDEATERPWPAGIADSPSSKSTEQNGKPAAENPAAAAIRLIPGLVSELKAYAAHYVSAKLDGFKLTARNAAVYAALGVVGLLVGAGVIVTAVALLVVGIAHAIGALCGGRLWLGDIIIGVLILGSVALAIYLPLSKFFKTSRVKTEQKYEGKRIQQRVEHGRDVSERAARQTPGK